MTVHCVRKLFDILYEFLQFQLFCIADGNTGTKNSRHFQSDVTSAGKSAAQWEWNFETMDEAWHVVLTYLLTPHPSVASTTFPPIK